MSIIEKPIEEETVVVPDVLPEVDPATQALIDAKAYIMEHGWCQTIAQNADGNVCILGSLISTYTCWSAYSAATTRLFRVVQSPITVWNDSSKRKVEEVYEAFDRAIAYKE